MNLPDLGPAGLIIRALGGTWDGLGAFFPGAGLRQAVTSVVACHRNWSGQGRMGEISAQGIGEWAWGAGVHSRGNALVWVTWPEVIAVIGRGCDGGGYRERYEAARAAWDALACSGSAKGVGPVVAELKAAGAARVRHGCEQPEPLPAGQLALFGTEAAA